MSPRRLFAAITIASAALGIALGLGMERKDGALQGQASCSCMTPSCTNGTFQGSYCTGGCSGSDCWNQCAAEYPTMCPSSPSCGNGVIDGSEQCDGASLGGATCDYATASTAPSGSLGCNNTTCQFDTSGCSNPSSNPVCGNGVKEGTEQCDCGGSPGTSCTADQLGGQTCASLAYPPGTLGCAACAFLTSQCNGGGGGGGTCGDGIIGSGEQCDPPATGACSNTCQIQISLTAASPGGSALALAPGSSPVIATYVTGGEIAGVNLASNFATPPYASVSAGTPSVSGNAKTYSITANIGTVSYAPGSWFARLVGWLRGQVSGDTLSTTLSVTDTDGSISTANVSMTRGAGGGGGGTGSCPNGYQCVGSTPGCGGILSPPVCPDGSMAIADTPQPPGGCGGGSPSCTGQCARCPTGASSSAASLGGCEAGFKCLSLPNSGAPDPGNICTQQNAMDLAALNCSNGSFITGTPTGGAQNCRGGNDCVGRCVKCRAACIPPGDVIAGGACGAGSVCTGKAKCLDLGGANSGAGCGGTAGDNTTCCTLGTGICAASSAQSSRSSVRSASSSAVSLAATCPTGYQCRTDLPTIACLSGYNGPLLPTYCPDGSMMERSNPQVACFTGIPACAGNCGRCPTSSSSSTNPCASSASSASSVSSLSSSASSVSSSRSSSASSSPAVSSSRRASSSSRRGHWEYRCAGGTIPTPTGGGQYLCGRQCCFTTSQLQRIWVWDASLLDIRPFDVLSLGAQLLGGNGIFGAQLTGSAGSTASGGSAASGGSSLNPCVASSAGSGGSAGSAASGVSGHSAASGGATSSTASGHGSAGSAGSANTGSQASKGSAGSTASAGSSRSASVGGNIWCCVTQGRACEGKPFIGINSCNGKTVYDSPLQNRCNTDCGYAPASSAGSGGSAGSRNSAGSAASGVGSASRASAASGTSGASPSSAVARSSSAEFSRLPVSSALPRSPGASSTVSFTVSVRSAARSSLIPVDLPVSSRPPIPTPSPSSPSSPSTPRSSVARPVACAVSADCPFGRCVDGACSEETSAPAACDVTGQCASAETVAGGARRCARSADCPFGECVDGMCREASCRDGSQCPFGACIGGQCRRTEENAACGGDAQCAFGRCVDGRCVLPLCARDDECVFGVCRDGRCRILTGTDRQVLGASTLAAGPECGDGRLTRGEECDDGNRRDLDGCSAACRAERGRCGDGIVQSLLEEQCDPPAAGRCSAVCRLVLPRCGDGQIDPGEGCDDGMRNADAAEAACRADCSPARCGDGIVNGNERCDDRNRVSGDGCSDTCLAERAAAQDYAAQVLPGTRTDGPGGLTGWNGASGACQLDAQCESGLCRNGQCVACGSDAQCGAGRVCLASRCLASPNHAPVGDTGPAAVAVIAAGAAGGWGWARRRRRAPSGQ